MSSLKPEIAVAAVTAVDGRFLIVEERIRGRLVFNQPAGRVEDRESLIDAVVRETREETAWQFEPQALLGIYHWRNPDTSVTALRFAFRGAVSDHRPDQPLDAPVIAAHWLTVDELRQREAALRNPLVMCCVNDWLAGKGSPLNLIADHDLAKVARIWPVQASS